MTLNHDHGIQEAITQSNFSTCISSQYGAAIFDPETGYIISTGRNGAPRGKDHCTDNGWCFKRELGYDHFATDVKEWQGMQYCVCTHAEINALIQAGSRAFGCVMYLCGKRGDIPIIPKPCFQCTKTLINAGVTTVIIKPGSEFIEIDTSVLYDKYLVEIAQSIQK